MKITRKIIYITQIHVFCSITVKEIFLKILPYYMIIFYMSLPHWLGKKKSDFRMEINYIWNRFHCRNCPLDGISWIRKDEEV